ncbi:MAG: hypothetical protein GX556_04200 [Fibrobacter sp.]|nr:hypothetical protein [Fibrobacter sp.]
MRILYFSNIRFFSPSACKVALCGTVALDRVLHYCQIFSSSASILVWVSNGIGTGIEKTTNIR